MPDTSEFKLSQYRIEKLESKIAELTEAVDKLENEMIPIKTLNKWVMGGIGAAIGALVARALGVF